MVSIQFIYNYIVNVECKNIEIMENNKDSSKL
jgi:hypothetical protein